MTLKNHLKFLPHHTLVGVLYMVGIPFAVVAGIFQVVVEKLDEAISWVLGRRI